MKTIALHATSHSSGYGHQRITVTLQKDNGEVKEFSSVTNCMPDFDKANELEGQERYDALYDCIATKIADQVDEWEIENK